MQILFDFEGVFMINKYNKEVGILLEKFNNGDSFPVDDIIKFLIDVYKKEGANMPNEDMLVSIAYRMYLVLEYGIDGLFDITSTEGKNKGGLSREERNRIVLLKNPTSRIYRIEFCADKKVELYDFLDRESKSRPVTISLDLTTGRLFISSRVVIGRNKDNLKVVNYCMPCFEEIKYTYKKGTIGQKEPDKDILGNAILIDEFHPREEQGFLGNKKYHKNNIKDLDLDDCERLLMQQIFGFEAPEPHFHYFSERISTKLGGNDKSLAINLTDLKKYVSMLVFFGEKTNGTTLKKRIEAKPDLQTDILCYDLEMPYLSILRGDLTYSNTGFLQSVKDLLEKYNSTNNKRGEKIELIYYMMDNLSRGQEGSGLTGLEALKAIYSDLEIIEIVSKYCSAEVQMSIFDLYSEAIKKENFAKDSAEKSAKDSADTIIPIPTPIANAVEDDNDKPKPIFS